MNKMLVYLTTLLVVVLTSTGCAVIDDRYSRYGGGCGYYGCQPRESGAVVMIKEHSQAVHAVNDPGLIPVGNNCEKLDYGVVYTGENRGSHVSSYGGQKCKGGPTSAAGMPVTAPSFEECARVNFSAPACAIYAPKGE